MLLHPQKSRCCRTHYQYAGVAADAVSFAAEEITTIILLTMTALF